MKKNNQTKHTKSGTTKALAMGMFEEAAQRTAQNEAGRVMFALKFEEALSVEANKICDELQNYLCVTLQIEGIQLGRNGRNATAQKGNASLVITCEPDNKFSVSENKGSPAKGNYDEMTAAVIKWARSLK